MILCPGETRCPYEEPAHTNREKNGAARCGAIGQVSGGKQGPGPAGRVTAHLPVLHRGRGAETLCRGTGLGVPGGDTQPKRAPGVCRESPRDLRSASSSDRDPVGGGRRRADGGALATAGRERAGQRLEDDGDAGQAGGLHADHDYGGHRHGL